MWKCSCCETMNQDEQTVCIVCGKTHEAEILSEENEKRAEERKGNVSFKTIIILAAALLTGLIIFLLSSQMLPNQGKDTALVQRDPAGEPVYLTLGFHQTYQCSSSDFDLPEDVSDSLTWSCAANDTGVTCSPGGAIDTGNILADPSLGYNQPIQVVGTNGKDLTLVYYLITGSGQNFAVGWSGNRTMRNYIGPVYQITPMVTNCSGFTLTFKSTLISGDIIGDQWSVWVRENGTDWVYVQDITVQNNAESSCDIVFDGIKSFSEIAVQPPKQYNPYSNTVHCVITNLVMN